MKKDETQWSEAAVLVCTKCHKSIDPDLLKDEGNCGENLKSYLKLKIREAGKGHEIRVMTSSCLDICEAGAQAVTYTPVAPTDKKTQTFVLHPEKDRDELLAWILRHP